MQVQTYVMSNVLKDCKIITEVSKGKYETTIENLVQKMELTLFSPEDIILKEGDAVESNIFLQLSSLN